MDNIHRRVSAVLCFSVLLGVFGVCSAEAGDEWLAKIALSELNRAAENGEYEKLSAQVKGAILGRLSVGKIK